MGIEEVGTSGRRGLRPWWAHGEAPAVVGTRMQAIMQANRRGGTVRLNCSQGGRQHCKSRSLGRRSVLHASAGWQVVASFRVPKLEFPISKTQFRNLKKEYPTIKSEYTKLQEHYQLLGGHIKRICFAQNMLFS